VRLSPLERGLRLFTDVRAGEGLTALVMFVNIFLVLCAYYFVKPLRDGWIAIADVGTLSKMEVKAYTSFAQSVVLVFVVTGFARLAARLPRQRLITASTLFCMFNLVVFWILRPGYLDQRASAAGVAFYIWVGMFGVFVVSQFWAFAADLYTEERGRRLLPLIAIGATLGAATGSLLTGAIMRWVAESSTLLLVALVPLGASIILTNIADARGAVGEGRATARVPAAAAAAGGAKGGGGAWGLIYQHRYLLAVAGITLLTNWVSTNGENLLFGVVQEALGRDLAAAHVTDPRAVLDFVREGTTAFYGEFFFWVNACALFMQALLASRLLKYGGFAPTLLLLPVISLVTYATMAALPVLLVVRVMKTAENSTAYSINNTARHVLWLPTTAEMKYKAKPAIDTFVVRLGDGMAAATVLVGVHFLVLSIDSLLLFNVGLVVAWLALCGVVVHDYRRMTLADPAVEPPL
jgi:AAA family ATP:ADP antiporter